MTDRTLFHVVLAGELITSIVLDAGDAEFGMTVKERNGEFYIVDWQSTNGILDEGDEISLKKGSTYDILLHPRAKSEALEVVKLAQSAKTESIVSLFDLLHAIQEEK